MKLNYIVKDNQGNAGQTIAITQGESRVISVFLFNNDGSPYVFSGAVSELLVKAFSAINQSSIQKKLSLSEVTLINLTGGFSGMTGFQFVLSSANTTSMAANNSGLPMIATITDNDSNVLELDFISIFNVTAPVVLT